MKLPLRLSLRAGFWLVLLLSVFAWAPATYPGYWQALEGFIPSFNVSHSAPLANVAVQADLWRGIGSGTFLLVRPFLLLGLEPTTAVRIGFILLFLLGGLGCYSWLQPNLGDRAAGLAGLLYLFAPPLLATVYIRGSLSDATVVALLPLVLAGLTIYGQNRTLSAAGVAVIAILWMWQAQAGLAAWATLLLFGYALLVERQWLVVLIVVVSAIAGLSSLTPVLNVTAAPPVPFTDHFVYLFQLLQQQWHFAPSMSGWQDEYPMQLGLPILLLTLFALVSIAGGYIARWRATRPAAANQRATSELPADLPPVVLRLWWFSLGVLLLLVLLTLPWSQPFWQWSQADRLLSYPWQLLLLSLPFAAMTAGALPAFNPQLQRTPLWVGAAGLVLLSSYTYLVADYTQVEPPATPVALFGEQSEIVILDAAVTENRQPRSTEITLTWQLLRPLAVDYNLFLQALRSEDQALTIVSQLDLQPLGTELPATAWQQGKIYQNTYKLDLAEVPANATLSYYVGFYDWRDGTRLPVNWGVDDKLIFHGQ